MRRQAIIAIALAAVAAPAAAHHGWGSYDAGTTLVLEAPIQEVGYENPHGMLVVEHDGKRWHVVLAPPARMTRRGLAPEMLAAGTPVRIEGYPSKVADGEMRAERIAVAGKTVELR
jgi:hypothetical protein